MSSNWKDAVIYIYLQFLQFLHPAHTRISISFDVRENEIFLMTYEVIVFYVLPYVDDTKSVYLVLTLVVV